MNLAQTITLIQQSQNDRNIVIEQLFNDLELKNKVVVYIKKNGGSKEDGLYIFDEMIVQFIKTAIAKSNLQYNVELNAYLMGIVHHLWYKEKEKKNKFSELKPHQEEFSNAYEEIFLNKERYAILNTVLTKLRANCRAVLMHWANGFSMQEIADKLGYQSEGMARKKKSQCMAELNDFLINHPNIKDQLK